MSEIPAKEMLKRYSTPGLRRNTLSKVAKKEHLANDYQIKGEAAKKILDELYPEEKDK